MSFSCPRSVKIIAERTVVVVNSLRGENYLSWHVSEAVGIEVASLSIMQALGQRRNIPLRGGHLVWAHPHANRVVVTFVATVISDEIWEEIMSSGQTVCFICCDPCADADDPFAKRTREVNCDICTPCYLCARCSVMLPNGTHRCLACLTSPRRQR